MKLDARTAGGAMDRRGGEELDAGAGGLRRSEREDAFDVEVLRWASRFAFVTAATAAERFGVSEQRMRARLRRLERERWVRRFRLGAREPVRVVVSEAGADRVGVGVRTPRGREPLGHELAVIKRVIAIERYFAAFSGDGARVLTERDMRRDERREGGRRVVGGGRASARPAGSALGRLRRGHAGGADGGGVGVLAEGDAPGAVDRARLSAPARRMSSWISWCSSVRRTRACGGVWSA